MNNRSAVVLFFMLLSTPLLAREKTDVIVMKNGDRFTCEIKGLTDGVLYVGLDYVDGTISVQWSEVATLESTHLYIVTTEDGLVYSGSIATAASSVGQPVKIQVAQAPDATTEIDKPRVIKMDETSGSFWGRFAGDISSGILYSKGNESTQYSLSSVVEYPRDRWQASLSFDSSLAASTGTTASARNQVAANALRLLPWKNTFYAGSASLLQSSEQGIKLQSHLGGGIGHFLKSTNHASIFVLGGLAWQNTSYEASSTGPEDVQNIAAALITTEVKFFEFKKTNLDVSAQVLPAISEAGRVFFAVNASYYIKLFSNFSWNLTFYGNWDNRPPEGLSGADYGSTSGISWSFGNNH